METFKKSYAWVINPMPGPEEWLIDCDIEPIMPPLPRKQRGRPKNVRRRVGETELMKVLRIVRWDMMYVVETVVDKAAMIEDAPNWTIQIGRSGPRGFRGQN
jgi:hypothetical protein